MDVEIIFPLATSLQAQSRPTRCTLSAQFSLQISSGALKKVAEQAQAGVRPGPWAQSSGYPMQGWRRGDQWAWARTTCALSSGEAVNCWPGLVKPAPRRISRECYGHQPWQGQNGSPEQTTWKTNLITQPTCECSVKSVMSRRDLSQQSQRKLCPPR